jgi:hypothetical protein
MSKSIIWIEETTGKLKKLGATDEMIQYIISCSTAESRAYWCTRGPKVVCAAFGSNPSKYLSKNDFPTEDFVNRMAQMQVNVVKNYAQWLKDRPGRHITNFSQKPLNIPKGYYKECVAVAPGGSLFKVPPRYLTYYAEYTKCVNGLLKLKFSKRADTCRELILHPKFKSYTMLESVNSLKSYANSSNTTLYKVPKIIDNIIRREDIQVIDNILLSSIYKHFKGSFKLLIRLPQQLNNLPTPIKFTMFSVYLYIKRERILNIIKQSKDIFNPKGIDINQNEEYLTSSDI